MTTAPHAPHSGVPAPHRTRNRVLWTALILVIALVAAIAASASWTVQRSFPTYAGDQTVPGLAAEVTVQRDARGIATITADTSGDLFFAQGYVHAQDRFWEMDFRRHTTAGRLSELFGDSQVATDLFLRTLGWHEVAQAEFTRLDDASRGYYEAYAAGVNAYLAQHHGADLSLEYAVLGLQNPGYEPEPWSPVDSIAWLKAMAWDLRTNIEEETDRALLAQSFDADQIADLFPPYPFDRHPTIVPPQPGSAAAAGAVRVPNVTANGVSFTEVSTVIEAASALLGDTTEGVGSNSWVVSGEHTDTGMPLLANDPHLGAAMPSVWHQSALRCSAVSPECPFDVSGFGFAGLPGIVIGHNADIAWGFTNLTTDVSDLFIEKVDGDTYLRDGKMVPMTIRDEVIKVAGGEDVPLTIRSTVHGPIVSPVSGDFGSIAEHPTVTSGAGDYAVSLRWSALDVTDTPRAIFAINTAHDWESFRAGAARFQVPAQNLVYADIEGNIGYQAPGILPIRGAGDGATPAPGWDSAYDWSGYIPFDDLPRVHNPAQSFIVTANNAIVGDDYDHFLTHDWDYGYRAARITELVQDTLADGRMTAADMRDIQMDQQFWMGDRLARIADSLPVSTASAKAAVALLDGWDGQNGVDSAPAAYANVVWDTLATTLFVDGRDAPISVSDQSRLFTVVDGLLDDEDSPWWRDPTTKATGRDAVLTGVFERAAARLVDLQGSDPSEWRWGSLHAITITSATFGSSGIAPIEALFNRGPYEVGGGSSIVDATGWSIGESFATQSVPSMRMVIDLADFDRSTWIHLTGTSGHAFHPNYVDQTEAWARGEQKPWAFTDAAVDRATQDTLVLAPPR